MGGLVVGQIGGLDWAASMCMDKCLDMCLDVGQPAGLTSRWGTWMDGPCPLYFHIAVSASMLMALILQKKDYDNEYVGGSTCSTQSTARLRGSREDSLEDVLGNIL